MTLRRFTSESVTEGHPDKICDQISDAVLDHLLTQDRNSRLACETLVKGNLLVVAGEQRSNGSVDVPNLVRRVLREIGYSNEQSGCDVDNLELIEALEPQSPDIAQGVDSSKSRQQGAGDQGMMFGFACNETPELMPLPIMLAHRLARRLAEARKRNDIKGLGPDGKVQVTIAYNHGRPVGIETILISSQHAEDVTTDALRRALIDGVIAPTLEASKLTMPEQILINPTGRFVQGGPAADAGLTGRKIIVDTYGGMGRHGGGAFSGKDPSKVDRSAAYFARYIAKNVVASGLASRCEVQLAYAIGRAEPVSLMLETFGTSQVPEDALENVCRDAFDARPASLIEALGLLQPIYRQTAAYGHFGRTSDTLPWERTDRAQALAAAFGPRHTVELAQAHV